SEGTLSPQKTLITGKPKSIGPERSRMISKVVCLGSAVIFVVKRHAPLFIVVKGNCQLLISQFCFLNSVRCEFTKSITIPWFAPGDLSVSGFNPMWVIGV